ncbi:transmembrane protein 208 [Danaus plexippus]|uniref:Transmembrane protein 208 n=1 Tax=Danaus plexippus plexippus TaxID=278856 RepID=A0A212EXW6_DANPL|nr:transmembrane protein 208 [Danaus plexippus]OWR46338.1 hypothetical protein KGM_206153 [Danaus plexippus plexippus]
MPPPQKGKAPTKGAKQILTENAATVSFYRNMAVCAGLFFNIYVVVLNYESATFRKILMNVLVTVIYVICYQSMLYISRPHLTDTKQIIDPGLDLNMEGGMGEHIKDVVILTSITHILAAFSEYFWLLLLLLPIRVFWLVWVNFLGPWFFQEAPQETEQDEKKRKKMERKMKRFQ